MASLQLDDCRFSRFLGIFSMSSHEACLEKAEPPTHCMGRLLVVTGWRPVLHTGEARGPLYGRGREATGAWA